MATRTNNEILLEKRFTNFLLAGKNAFKEMECNQKMQATLLFLHTKENRGESKVPLVGYSGRENDNLHCR